MSKNKPKEKQPKQKQKPLPKTIGGKPLSQPMKAGLTAVAAIAKGGSKLDTVIKLLERPEGATIDDLVKATQWQKHTVRSAISHTLVKKKGYEVASDKPKGGERIYKIAAPK